MSELTNEQHNNEIWAKIAKLQEHIDELRAELKPIEAVEEIPLHILNGDAIAARMAEFAKRDAAKEALNEVLGQANEQVRKPRAKAKA
jgi:hypothetical protein